MIRRLSVASGRTGELPGPCHHPAGDPSPDFSPSLGGLRICRKDGALQTAEKPYDAVIPSPFAVILSAAKNLALPAQGELREGSRSEHFQGNARFFLRKAQDRRCSSCRNSTRKSLEFSRCSANLFFRSAARPRWTRKSRGPKKQVRATLPRPEFLPIVGSRTAVNAQNDSAFEFFRSL